jgi:hypothetical protein
MSNHLKRTTAALALLLALAAAASGQGAARGAKAKAEAIETEDAVERLLDRHVLAQGGIALAAVRTLVMRGRVDMSESPIPGTFEVYEKFPGKSMFVVNAPGGQVIGASDGDKHWLQTPWGARTSTGGSYDLMAQAAKGKGFKWRNAFSTSSLKGRAKIDGSEMIVLAATPLGGEPMLLYFDAETYLLRKSEPVHAVVGPDGFRLTAVYIDSYATVDGVKEPALFRQVFKEYTLTFRATEIRHNVPINDVLFESPTIK